MLEALGVRDLDFALPPEPNFRDRIVPYVLDPASFEPGSQVPRVPKPRTFEGYSRPGNRGTGTRNHIVLLGTSSRTASFVTLLASRLRECARERTNLDGIVAAGHTEGGASVLPHNRELLIRTLAGLILNPNVGAVLAVDYGAEKVRNRDLQEYFRRNANPLEGMPHCFYSIGSSVDAALADCEATVRGWLQEVTSTPRTPAPLSDLKIALQCGGSDAFSGVSGNPLVSCVARHLIMHGGSANLAETNELIGAEPYVLANVRDLDTARSFLGMVDRYKTLASWHDTSAEGNPSGGNKFRGLYNIVLKSIGAAQKRHQEVRLDGVLEYSQRVSEPGFYFMDSPGNDPESIAGQVAAGCTLVFFVTGNGAITNFPFAPTVKVLTTSTRYALLAKDMDINAGEYLEGTPMDVLAERAFEMAIDVASGVRTKGEAAGHTQLSIWRDWPQVGADNLDRLLQSGPPAGSPLPYRKRPQAPSLSFQALRTSAGLATDRVGLVLPTSICSGEVGRMAAERLDRKRTGHRQGVSRFVSLVHTEGCGMAEHPSEALFDRAVLGYLTHPIVHAAFILEHGCEKTHNDYVRHVLEASGDSPDRFGWGSIQMDGGIENVLDKAEAWFLSRLEGEEPPGRERASLGALRLGILTTGCLSGDAWETVAGVTQTVLDAGGLVVHAGLPDALGSEAFRGRLGLDTSAGPTLAYGQRPEENGLHVMDTPTSHASETLSGLGATGVEVMLAWVGEHPVQGHPMLPVLQTSDGPSVAGRYGQDLDYAPTGQPEEDAQALLDLIARVASREYTPAAARSGNLHFQLTRGHLGLSM